MSGHVPGIEPGAHLDIDRELIRAGAALRLFAQPGPPIRLGKFEILRRPGSGAMGAVYEALDPEYSSRVALKLLMQLDVDAIHRFKREFRALCDVVHPNLAVLHELYVEHDQAYFTMELVDGQPFDAWVRGPHGVLDEARLCKFDASQGYATRLCPERILAVLRRDRAALESVDAALRRQGVCDPERWVWTHVAT